MDQFVVCLRVSTAGQDRSKLGPEARQAAVSRYLTERPGEVLETLTIEVMAAMAEYERELIGERTREGEAGRGEGAGRGARGGGRPSNGTGTRTRAQRGPSVRAGRDGGTWSCAR